MDTIANKLSTTLHSLAPTLHRISIIIQLLLALILIVIVFSVVFGAINNYDREEKKKMIERNREQLHKLDYQQQMTITPSRTAKPKSNQTNKNTKTKSTTKNTKYK